MKISQYFVIEIIISKVNCKLRNYIYLLTCNDGRVQYVGESLAPLNKTMNIYRKEKPGCEILVNHCKNVCENASFTIQNVQKLTANAHKN